MASTHPKNMSQIGFHFPKVRGEHNKSLSHLKNSLPHHHLIVIDNTLNFRGDENYNTCGSLVAGFTKLLTFLPKFTYFFSPYKGNISRRGATSSEPQIIFEGRMLIASFFGGYTFLFQTKNAKIPRVKKTTHTKTQQRLRQTPPHNGRLHPSNQRF